MTKSKKTAAADDAEDALNQAQGVFTANPMFQPAGVHFMATQGPIQDYIRKEMETYTEGWLKRREAATRALSEATSKLVKTGMRDPVAATKVMTDWQSGVVERLTADAHAYGHLLACCTEELIKTRMDTMDEMSKSIEVFGRNRQATPV